MENVKEILNDIAFSNEEFEKEMNEYNFDKLISNPAILHTFINDIDIIKTKADLSQLQCCIDNTSNSTVSDADIKSVFLQLKERAENPRGYFDKMGRFYVNDSELCDVGSPSIKYPYTQMNNARTARFVKKLAKKYGCQNIQELENVAFKENKTYDTINNGDGKESWDSLFISECPFIDEDLKRRI